jgi:hypothetical protein
MRILCFALACLLTAPGLAQIDVAICASASTVPSDCRFTDVQSKLIASGQFNSVALLDCVTTTPSLVQLQAYDAVITWSNFTYLNGAALGDVLADYVDAGGGVVVAVFANSDTMANRFLGGRWQTGYEVILDQGTTTTGPATLGTVLLPSHPVMTGVTNFSGGTSSFRPTLTALEVGSITIATWSDGRILVAEGANPKRIDLGFYPPSSACSSGFWTQGTDGDKLLANALAHVAAGGFCAAPLSYCTTSTTSNGCNPALTGTGVPSASLSSGLVLTCANVEGQKSGIVFYGISGPNAGTWATGSTSWLCVKAPTQRTGTQNSGGTLGTCSGVLTLDFLAYMSSHPTALGQPLSVGQQFNAQAWFRDPPAPKTTNLSGGVQWVMCP